MSEFNFLCPACGQNISCGTAHAGTQITCPICKADIIAPQAAAPVGDFIEANTPPPWTGHNGTSAQRTSGLAVASLVCSLASLIMCVGWLPGIICGHLAKSKMRRNSSLKGRGLATAGLAIGYIILILEAGTVAVHVWRFSSAMKHGYENVRQNLATNMIIVTQTQSTAVPNGNQQIKSIKPATIATNNQQTGLANSGWTFDVGKISFPDHSVGGKLHGIDFIFRGAFFRNGILRINSTNGTSVEIRGLGKSIDGRNYEIRPVDDNSNPHVKITWNEGDVVQSETFSKNYAMKLQFGEAKSRKVSAKIYLCFPDASKSYVAGTFETRLLKQKTAN